MPPKAHRPGLVRNHSHTRTTSGSSSKVALNLHFTQKEPSQPKSDKPKRHSYGQYTANRTTSAVQKSNSTARVSSRDNVAGLAQAPNKAPTTRRASDKSQSTVTNGTKHRAGFTLASSAVGSDDDDDDEWVSSESGAATPDKHRDDHTSSGSDDAPVKTPQDTRQDPLRLVLPPPGKLHVNVDGQIQPVAAMTALREDRTPTLPPSPAQQQQQQPPTERRLDKSATLRSPGAGPRPPAVTPTHVDFPTSPPAQLMSSRSAVPLATPRVQPPTPETAKAPRTPSPSPQSQAHSRTQPPTPTSPRPRQQHRSKRTSITRPPSITSDHAPTLRPHPLIRGNSYGLSHLAPLSISSTAAKAQLSASPPSPAGLSRVPASAGPSSSESRFNRRLSTSSTKSSATLPAPSSSTTLVGGGGGGTPGSSSGSRKDRTRTLSTLSSGSSAALSSLAHIPIKAPPRRDALAAFPRFPPAAATASAAASLHALLPQPYVQPHATVLVWRTPIRESCERVLRAKARNRAG